MSHSALRIILLTLTFSTFLLASITLPSAAQRAVPRPPQPVPSPNAPNNNVPSGLDGPPLTATDPQAPDLQNQAEIKAEIEKLYALVFELREQMKQTDATNTLSLTVVKKAQAIEKLAKQIKDRSKR
jgi:peptidoglycan hydrolase CwlO-like protein